MNITSAFILFAVIIPATSFAWGMRGTTIGGEKGAMLPGAMIGTILALCSNILIVQENFFIFAGLGAIAMYFGGCMTYGETLSFSMSAYPATDLGKGLGALALKGFLWFSVFGAIFTTGISAVAQRYSIIELVIIFTLTPTLALIGLRLFNRPHNLHDVKFPKIYFSKTRKEYWGAMVGILTSLLIINIIKLNWYSVIFALICGTFGGIGWVIGQLLQIYFIHKAKKSSFYLIRMCAEKGYFESWKAMECTLGAFGGVGCAVAFIVTYKQFKEAMFVLELTGGSIPYNSTLSKALLVVWIVLLVADMLHYYIKKPRSIAELKNSYINGEISPEKYTKKMFKATPDTKKNTAIDSFLEAYEFIVYAVIPFVLISLGCSQSAQIMAFFMLYWVLAQEIGFENNFHKIPLTVLGVICLVLQLFIGIHVSIKATIILYTVIYEVFSLIYLIKEITEKENSGIQLSKSNKIIEKIKLVLKSKSFLTTHVYFIICIIATLVII